MLKLKVFLIALLVSGTVYAEVITPAGTWVSGDHAKITANGTWVGETTVPKVDPLDEPRAKSQVPEDILVHHDGENPIPYSWHQ